MSQALLKTARILAFLPFIAFTKSTAASSREPDFYCYKRLPNGQVVNLNDLCGSVAVPSSGPDVIRNRVRISRNARKLLDFVEYSYDGRRLVATVRNKSKDPLSSLSIGFSAYNRAGGNEVIADAGSADAAVKVLAPNGTTTFKAQLDKESDFIEITSVETEQSQEATLTRSQSRRK